MNKFYYSIRDICHNHFEYLISLKNVNGVGLGFKHINKVETKELCIHVFVENKVDSKYLTYNNIIPKKYMGIKTDVIEAKRPKICSGEPAVPHMLRPLEGGCGISVKNSVGTLGCIVTKGKLLSKEYFILSNNHVIADSNTAPIGFPIVQPPPIFLSDIVAHLTTFVPLKFIEDEKKPVSTYPINYVDCAIAKITKKSLISNKIYGIGKIKGVSKAKLGEHVKKVGYLTGLTEGKILSLEASTIASGKSKPMLFKGQILSDLTVIDGDSGSALLNDNNEIIGLIHAMGGYQKSYVSDINLILEELEVKIYTG